MTKLAPLMSSDRSDWQTPECVLERVREVGTIALDPCTSPDNPVGADHFFANQHEEDDGLRRRWDYSGVAYVNPPYGRALPTWMAAIRNRVELSLTDNTTIALVPARTDTLWFDTIWQRAQAVCFWRGRLTFKGAPGPAPFPSALAYWGPRPHRFGAAFEDAGRVVML